MGKIATRFLAKGNGWSAVDAICSFGPLDRPFEEQHASTSIALALEGSFRYRSTHGSSVICSGSLMLGNAGECYECGHQHGIGDRCLAFYFSPDFFERARLSSIFPIHQVPPIRLLTPLIVKSQIGLWKPDDDLFEELAFGLAEAVEKALERNREVCRAPSASDERRVLAVLRFIESHRAETLPLHLLASNAKMSEFHFLRVFKQVTGVTPHQYIQQSRLRDAALLLSTTSAPVTLVAMDAGFRDLSHFNHLFRAQFGVNPTYFRRMSKG